MNAGGTTCRAPTLTIVAPRAHATVEAPFRVRYQVACFQVRGTRAYLRAYLNPERDGMRFSFRLWRREGSVLFPDHPLASGRRTVLFELARADGSRVRAPSARVLVPLTIEGSRSP